MILSPGASLRLRVVPKGHGSECLMKHTSGGSFSGSYGMVLGEMPRQMFVGCWVS